jgi:rod shape-determining protein MreC
MNWFQKIYEFFIKFRDYIVYTSLVVISLSLISLGDFTTIGGLRASIVALVGFINEKVFIFPNISALKKENQILRELNIELSNEITRNYLAEKENRELRKLLELKQKTTQNITFCDVVGIEKIGNKNYLIINKGKADGLDFGMIVRTDAGLVGTIAASSNGYSIVETIYNPDVHISVILANSSLKGILTYDGVRDLIIDNIPKTLEVKKGEEVLTSNFSSRFPPDIPIGKVERIEIPRSSLFYRVVVKPYAYYSQVQQVVVIKELPDTNKINLIKEFFGNQQSIK